MDLHVATLFLYPEWNIFNWDMVWPVESCNGELSSFGAYICQLTVSVFNAFFVKKLRLPFLVLNHIYVDVTNKIGEVAAMDH